MPEVLGPRQEYDDDDDEEEEDDDDDDDARSSTCSASHLPRALAVLGAPGSNEDVADATLRRICEARGYRSFRNDAAHFPRGGSIEVDVLKGRYVELDVFNQLSQFSGGRFEEQMRHDLHTGRAWTVLDVIAREHHPAFFRLLAGKRLDGGRWCRLGVRGARDASECRDKALAVHVVHFSNLGLMMDDVQLPFVEVAPLLDPAGPFAGLVQEQHITETLATADNGTQVVVVSTLLTAPADAVPPAGWNRGSDRDEPDDVVRFDELRVLFSDGRRLFPQVTRKALALCKAPDGHRQNGCRVTLTQLHGVWAEFEVKTATASANQADDAVDRATLLRVRLDTGRPWTVRDAIRPELFQVWVRGVADARARAAHTAESAEDVAFPPGLPALDVNLDWLVEQEEPDGPFVLRVHAPTPQVLPWEQDWKVPVADVRDAIRPDGPWGFLIADEM